MDKRGQGDQEKDRLPRWRFRKERKLALRKAHRQRMAQARDQKKDRPEEEELEAHSHYIQQKRQWEEREKRYDMINLAKKRAAEAERLAKEASKVRIKKCMLWTYNERLYCRKNGGIHCYEYLCFHHPCVTKTR